MPTIKLRRGTAEQWTVANPVLASGEPGYETDTQKLKVGSGTEPWSELPYILDAEDLLEFFASLTENHTISGQWDFLTAPTINGSPIGTGGSGDLGAIIEALGTKVSRFGEEEYSGTHDFSGANVLGLAADGDSLSIVRYVASLNAERPNARIVVWLGFPEEPTNMSNDDFWVEPDQGGFETVKYDTVTPNLSAERPFAQTVLWSGFPTQPTNMINGDLWAQPEGA